MSQEVGTQNKTAPAAPALKLTLYDQVSGMLIALLCIVGAIVFLLAVAYLTQNIRFEYRGAIPVQSEPEGNGDPHQGAGEELEEPGVDEMPEVMEPQISAMLDDVQAVVSVSVVPDSLDGFSTVNGAGDSLGSKRAAGTGGTGGSVTPRWERWQVKFSSASLDLYAKQLDFFGIELAAIGGGSKDVEYASGLSKRPITRRTGPSAEEKRLFMTWTRGALKQFDLQLLKAAGIVIDGKECIQLYPPATENQMVALEGAKLAGKPLKSVKRTVFAIRSSGSGFEMYVADQQFQ